MTIPAGWQQHPSSPAHMYELANPQNVLAIPAAAPPPPAAMAAQPAPAATAAAAYGEADSSLIDGEAARMATGGGDNIWLDFKKLEYAGQEDMMRLRFMPPWAPGEKLPFIDIPQHTLLSSLVPWNAKGRVAGVDCHNHKLGPGNCLICAAVEAILSGQANEEAMKAARSFKANTRIRWQAIDVEKPERHMVQDKHPGGQPIVDANNQPVWKLQPGIFTCKKQMQRAILTVWQGRGDPTNPDGGYPLMVKKSKTGGESTDVDYGAVGLDKLSMDEALRPALGNLVDLNGLTYFRDVEIMQQIVAALHVKYGVSAGVHQVPAMPAPAAAAPPPPPPPAPVQEQWLPHPSSPGYEYNPTTQAVRPVQAAAPPPPPPVAAAPPPPPVAAPVAPAAVPPGPPGLPPPTAPGLHQGQPVGTVAPPPAPPGPPGFPPAPPGGPAMNPGMPPGVMSPGQLEQQLGGGALPPPPPPVPGAIPAAPGMVPPPPVDDGTPF